MFISELSKGVDVFLLVGIAVYVCISICTCMYACICIYACMWYTHVCIHTRAKMRRHVSSLPFRMCVCRIVGFVTWADGMGFTTTSTTVLSHGTYVPQAS